MTLKHGLKVLCYKSMCFCLELKIYSSILGHFKFEHVIQLFFHCHQKGKGIFWIEPWDQARVSLGERNNCWQQQQAVGSAWTKKHHSEFNWGLWAQNKVWPGRETELLTISSRSDCGLWTMFGLKGNHFELNRGKWVHARSRHSVLLCGHVFLLVKESQHNT